MQWSDVDPLDRDLTPTEAIALQQMVAKRELYVQQGRAREAHGAGTMIMMLWSVIHRFPEFNSCLAALEEIDTEIQTYGSNR